MASRLHETEDDVANIGGDGYMAKLLRELEHYREVGVQQFQQIVELQLTVKERERELAILQARIAVGELETNDPPKGAFQSVKQRAPVGQAYNGPPPGVFAKKLENQVAKEAALSAILKPTILVENKDDRVHICSYPFKPMKK